MSSGFNGMPNIKMEDGGMGSIPGLKVSTPQKHDTRCQHTYNLTPHEWENIIQIDKTKISATWINNFFRAKKHFLPEHELHMSAVGCYECLPIASTQTEEKTNWS